MIQGVLGGLTPGRHQEPVVPSSLASCEVRLDQVAYTATGGALESERIGLRQRLSLSCFDAEAKASGWKPGSL